MCRYLRIIAILTLKLNELLRFLHICKNSTTTYRKRLLISACIFDAFTSLVCRVRAYKKHALISKRLR